MLLLACAEGLSINDYLMFFIDGGNPIVTLDRPFAGGHFSAFIIGDITFDFLGFFALAYSGAVGL